jgi:diguanylate cyclase (GGDEF)-like protein
MELHAIFDHINAGLLVVDAEGRIHFANKWIRAYTRRDCVVGEALASLFALNEQAQGQLYRKIQTVLQLNTPSFISAEHDHYLLPLPNRKVFHSTFSLMQQEASIVPFDQAQGWVLIMLYDQTDLMVSKQQILQKSQQLRATLEALQSAHHKLEAQTQLIEKQANYDALTGLPNWTLLKDRLNNAIHTAEQAGLKVGVMYIDLDGFKLINDRYGASVGDALLCAVGQALSEQVGLKDTVARLSADEFVLVIPQLERVDEVASLVDSLLQRLSQSWLLDNETVFISASIGVSLYPDDGVDVDTLLKHADLAMENAKSHAPGGFKFFTESLDKRLKDSLMLEAELVKTINQRGFSLVYQPKYHYVAGESPRLIGAEALIRWIHPSLGFISPDRFIPLAEHKGLIGQITMQVLEQACKLLAALLAAGQAVPISINISALDLNQPLFFEQVMARLTQANVAPQWIELEVTERLALVSQRASYDVLERFRHAGVKIALDDFGTGYSSLSYLAQMPIDVLKIDKSFIDLYANGHRFQTLLKSIIELAHVFGYQPIAEGVETQEIADILSDYACHYFQGYYFSKPLARDDFIALCQSG